MDRPSYPCPCCGHLVFAEPPGSDDICLVCFWQDDLAQLRWPKLAGSTNMACLIEAQRTYASCGASEERFVRDVRKANEAEPMDSEWRPITDADPFETPDDSAPWPKDTTTLYYWRSTYWRRSRP